LKEKEKNSWVSALLRGNKYYVTTLKIKWFFSLVNKLEPKRRKIFRLGDIVGIGISDGF